MSLSARFWSKVQKGGPDECWPWTAAVNEKGYGRFGVRKGKTVLSHRFALGAVPPEMFVDHRCKNPPCCNPNHLRIVTPKINVLENSDSFAALNAAKQDCPRGHPYNEANTYHAKARKGRKCRICHREREAKRRVSK